MDLRSGHPFWLVSNPLFAVYPPAEGNLKSDVVVIGAGITGALVTLLLAKAGIDVITVDKREVCWGSTAASTALLQYEIDTPLHELREMYGRAFADRCYHSCARAIQSLQDLACQLPVNPHFQRKPSIYLAKTKSSAAKLAKEFAARQDAGFDVEWWDAADVAKQTGISRPAAIFSREGAQVDAYRMAHGALQQAAAHGARIYDRTAVRQFLPDKSGVDVILENGQIRTKHVVFATGYEVKDFLRKKRVVDLNSSFALVTEPLTGTWPKWRDDALIWEMAKPYFYLRTTADRRIIIGGEDIPEPDADKRDALLPAKTRKLERALEKLLPGIDAQTSFAWSGTFGETADGLPYIGTLAGFPRAFFALGFGGNGITYSILAAEIISATLRGEKHPDAELFSFDR